MPFFLVLPLIGKVAVSLGTILWTGAAAAGGTAAVAGHNNSKAKKKVQEANRLKDEADDEIEKLLKSLNSQYERFYDDAVADYKLRYDKLRAKMVLASESISSSVKRPSAFVFSDKLSKANLKSVSLDDVDWAKVGITSSNAMRGSYLASRAQAPIGSVLPATTGLAMGGAAAAFSVMGGFIEASQKRVTAAAASLAQAETYVEHIKALKKVHRKSVREDIEMRKGALASLFSILDDELGNSTPFAELEQILINAGEIISRRCFPKASKGRT